MPKQSEAWKSLERNTAKALGGERIKRGGDFSESAPDVLIPGHPEFRIDCKYRSGGFAHHSLLRECRDKYCKEKGDIALIVTKGRSERGAVVSLSLEDFAELLSQVRPGTHGNRCGGCPDMTTWPYGHPLEESVPHRCVFGGGGWERHVVKINDDGSWECVDCEGRSARANDT